MTLAEALQKPAVKLRYIAKATAQILIRGWLVHSADAYKRLLTYTLTALTFDGVALTLRASIALVEANDGSYFQDTDGTVYVNPPTGEDVYAAALLGTALYYFSKDGNILDNQYYEARLLSVPTLSLRIEPRFSGVGQIGSGSCSFINNDGWFDSLTDLRWSTIQFWVGADTPASTMAAADYQPFGFWKVQSTQATGTMFTMALVEPKAVLKNPIPVETFSQDDYPNIASEDVGRTIPRIYGKVFGVTPVCVDATAKRFKVASHAIYDLLEVRILQDNVWNSISFASKDLPNGEFTLGADWANNETVSVDLIGRKGADDFPMYNAAEIVQDILEYLGESNFDTAAFDASFNALDVGEQIDGSRRTILKPSLCIKEAAPAIDIISKINEVAGSFLFVDANGQWHYEVFQPKHFDDLDGSFTDVEINENSFSKSDEAREIFSKVNVKFAERTAEKWSESAIEEDTNLQHAARAGAPILRELSAPLFDPEDAAYYAQRLLATEAMPLLKYSFTVPWNGFLLKPGAQIAVNYDRQSVAGVLEILEARYNLDANQIVFLCGDRRGWADTFGWWVSDAVADFDASASEDARREAVESAGFWHGDDDLADAAASNSYRTSRFW